MNPTPWTIAARILMYHLRLFTWYEKRKTPEYLLHRGVVEAYAARDLTEKRTMEAEV